MKKLLISLVMLIPFVSGCANVDTRININDDKTASVVSSIAYEGNLADNNDPVAQVILKSYPKMLDKYYTVETVYSKNLSTVTATKKITNVEKEDLNLESLGFTTNLPSGKFVDVNKNFLVKSYNVDLTFDYPAVKDNLEIPEIKAKASGEASKIDPEYYNRYIDPNEVSARSGEDTEFDMAANLDDSAKQLTAKSEKATAKKEKKPIKTADTITFSVQMPSFASYNNADNVNGFEYSWNIKTDEPTVIKIQYVQYSGWALAFIILLGILLLVYVAKRIIRRDSTKRMDNIENIV